MSESATGSTPAKRFKVALSFPGEHREYVEEIAGILADRLGGKEKVLYDKYYAAEFARPNLGVYLPRLYNEESELIVAFLSQHYQSKEWTGLEWRAIHDRIKKKDDEAIMLVRFDRSEIDGLFSGDGHIDANDYNLEQVAELILERYALLCKTPYTPLNPETKPAPPPVNNLGAPNKNFVGRREELAALDKILKAKEVGVLAAVHGLGGLGKTALAHAYAHEYASRFPGGLWEISCSGHEDLAFGLIDFAEAHLELRFTDEERHNLALTTRRAVRALELKTNQDPMLMILDNVDKPAILLSQAFEELQRLSGLTMLVTSRMGEQELSARNGGLCFINVDILTPEDALELVGKYRPLCDETERTTAGELARRLGYHTLAIELAAVYLGEHRSIAIKDFVRRLEKEGLDGLENAAGDTHKQIQYAEKSVRAALAPAWEVLDDQTRMVLAYAALCPPERVPISWLKALAIADAPKLAAETEPGYPDQWEDLLSLLGDRRLLVSEKDAKLARMHRLLQEVITKLSDAYVVVTRREKLLTYTLARAEALENEWVDWSKRWELDPLLDFTWQALKTDSEQATKLATTIAKPLNWLGRIIETEPLYRRALEIDDRLHGSEHPDVARDCNDLGWVLHQSNRLKEAELLYLRALQIRQEKLGTENTDVALSLNNLASLYKTTNRPDKAELSYRRALEIREKSIGPKHFNVALILSNLAMLLLDKGQDYLEEAEELSVRALKYCKDNLDPEHPDLASKLNNLACIIEKDPRRIMEAEFMYRSALDIRKKSLGTDHPEVAISLNNLAGLLQATNRFEEAEPLFCYAIEIHEKSLGTEHPFLAVSLGNLALLFAKTGRFKEAEHFAGRALHIFLKSSAACGHAINGLRDTVRLTYKILKSKGMSPSAARGKIEATFKKEGLPKALWPKLKG